MKKHSFQLLSICLVLMLLALTGSACKPWKPPTPCTTTTTTAAVTTTTPATTTTPETTTIPATTTTTPGSTTTSIAMSEYELWEHSAHADSTAAAFRDWDNTTNPASNVTYVGASCASCHSTQGYYEYLSTNNRTIANPPLAKNNINLSCDTCHSDRADAKTSVLFSQSGQTVNNPGPSAVLCGQCHQGRAWYQTVDTQIKKAYPNGDNATTRDRISSKIGSSNPHYRAAFAAIYASKSQIAYNYGNTATETDLVHEGGTDCMVCHNQHSLEVKTGTNCQPCHNINSLDDILAFPRKAQIDDLVSQLYDVIKQYAADDTTVDAGGNTKVKACIAYDDTAYPYWWKDANCDGVAEHTDNSTKYGYNSFTPRLAKACYNMMLPFKDPGIFAHNPTYAIAFLNASINDIKAYKNYPATDAEIATVEWSSSSHADYTAQAFRDWDNATNPLARVSASCASCHSTDGYNQYITNGFNRTIANPPLAVNNVGITCYACHSAGAYALTSVKFSQSGATVIQPGAASVICGQCHQGRAWQATVDTNIKKGYPAGDNATTIDKISSKITSTNPHYLGAFATLKASKSRIGYDYGDLTIDVDSTHPGGTDCMVCHNQHSLEIKTGQNCQPCHPSFNSLADILADKDQEVPQLQSDLLIAIRAYAADNTTLDAAGKTKAKACIVFNNDANPYWFKDDGTNGDLTACDGVQDNATSTNQYKSFTPRLARACYNMLVSIKDPGSFAHNSAYIKALLQKSIDNLNVYLP